MKNRFEKKILRYLIFSSIATVSIMASLLIIFNLYVSNRLLTLSFYRQLFIYISIVMFFIFIALSISLYFTERIRFIIDRYAQRLRQANEKLSKKHYYDELTGISNINKLEEDLSCLKGQETTLVCFCIANLTTLRDVYGFDIQKVVFLALIDRIVAALEIKDFKFYKLDNGKLIVMPFNTTIIKTENFQRLISKTNLFEVTFKGVKLNLFIELYIVVVTGENKLLEKIDFSLNKLQTEMKNFYIFDKSDEDFIKEYENIMHRITNVSQALDNDRVVPYYQPVYRSGEILFNEVLLRIAQNNGNIYIPARFLEAVRNTSLYPHLTRNLFDKVIDISKESTLPFSINLMREDILNEELCDYIFNRIEVNKLGSLFIFELKVDDVFKNIANFSDFTRRAKIAGCKICLDDFGPGFINLRDFVRLKADFIKIDGSLIMALAGNKDVANTIKSIVNLSENLHITVIAQYVQNESLYYTLKDLGIECMQGFFLGKPQATPHR